MGITQFFASESTGLAPSGVDIETSTGSLPFDDTTPVAPFQVSLSKSFSPSRISVNPSAGKVGSALASVRLAAAGALNQLPAQVTLQGSPGNTIVVQIDSLSAGQVDGQVITNNLTPGDTAQLEIVAYK